ncbi:M20 metallopeptidase family protein [Candidatus Laterigemmans baculatus]|uniref:M20 metallopeptidase family protein n=1 Tax=Candidatus Laterigemmans baculatus TaxID=2770505 RepID=UPI0013DB97F2|nr:amidohydrolase [Candidatus Laterigemmans baculatus]
MWTRPLLVLALVSLPFSLVESPRQLQAAEPADDGTAKAGPAAWFAEHETELVELYRWFHTHPELSFAEEETAARLAAALREAGFEVTEKVGGHGVVGLLKNGEGPTVMLRTDLDALPVSEQTQLPYASQKRVELESGGTTGVMHACGHDVHMTNLVAVARYLAHSRDTWSGTLMVIGQPAEERGAGARAMLEEGLFERFPKPDYAIALHVNSNTPAGTVSLAPDFVMANVDSVDIVVKGRGGHGAAPHTTIDPIVQAAELVLSLQTIVSREVKPLQPAVVTVGAIQGGTKHNVIGDSCHLQLTVRSYSDEVRAQVLSAIERRAKGIAVAYDAPEPEVRISEGTPALNNDAALAARMKEVFGRAVGPENVLVAEPVMGGEDFSRYGRAGVPILMYRLGSVSAERLERFEQLGVPAPSLHSPLFYPDLDPTLRTGFLTMSAAAIDLLQPQGSR